MTEIGVKQSTDCLKEINCGNECVYNAFSKGYGIIMSAPKISWSAAQTNMRLRTTKGQPRLSLFTTWYTMRYSPQGQPDSLFVKTAFLLPVSHIYNYVRTHTHAKVTFNSQL